MEVWGGGSSLLCLLGGRLIQIRPCATAMLDAQEHGAAWAGAREALPSTARRGASLWASLVGLGRVFLACCFWCLLLLVTGLGGVDRVRVGTSAARALCAIIPRNLYRSFPAAFFLQVLGPRWFSSSRALRGPWYCVWFDLALVSSVSCLYLS